MMKKSKRNNRSFTNIQCDVTVQSYNAHGEVIDAISAGAKLTKADAGRNESTAQLSVTTERDEHAPTLPKVTVTAILKEGKISHC